MPSEPTDFTTPAEPSPVLDRPARPQRERRRLAALLSHTTWEEAEKHGLQCEDVVELCAYILIATADAAEVGDSQVSEALQRFIAQHRGRMAEEAAQAARTAAD